MNKNQAIGDVKIDSDGFAILAYSCPNISRDLIKADNRGFILLLLDLTGKGAKRAKSGFV